MMPKRMTPEELAQEVYDLHAAMDLLRADVAIKLGLDERKTKLFFKIIDFADWFVTGWGYFQKALVYVGIIAGAVGLFWGKSWFGR